jgi:DNA-binding transcriptional LysR family regulator
MRPTDLGFFVRDTFGPLVREYDRARADAIAFAQGRHQQLRIGYIGLAAARYLNAALARLKQEFPQLRLMLFDQLPGEQLAGLREGRLDVALAGQEVARVAEDFYHRRVAWLKVCAVVPADHALAHRAQVSLAELQGSRFVGVAEHAVPGRNAWILELCAKAGLRAKFVAHTRDISETFALVAGEGAVALLPDYLEGAPPPGIAYVRLSDAWARWALVVLRQRGRGQPAARRLVELIGAKPA